MIDAELYRLIILSKSFRPIEPHNKTRANLAVRGSPYAVFNFCFAPPKRRFQLTVFFVTPRLASNVAQRVSDELVATMLLTVMCSAVQ